MNYAETPFASLEQSAISSLNLLYDLQAMVDNRLEESIICGLVEKAKIENYEVGGEDRALEAMDG